MLIKCALAALAGVHLAGAAYRGVAVAACIRDGAALAERIAASLDPSTQITTQAA